MFRSLLILTATLSVSTAAFAQTPQVGVSDLTVTLDDGRVRFDMPPMRITTAEAPQVAYPVKDLQAPQVGGPSIKEATRPSTDEKLRFPPPPRGYTRMQPRTVDPTNAVMECGRVASLADATDFVISVTKQSDGFQISCKVIEKKSE